VKTCLNSGSRAINVYDHLNAISADSRQEQASTTGINCRAILPHKNKYLFLSGTYLPHYTRVHIMPHIAALAFCYGPLAKRGIRWAR
jgi:hypothetical protein